MLLILNICDVLFHIPSKVDQIQNVVFTALFLVLIIISKINNKMEKKIELIPGTRVTIETSENGSTISICEKETPSYKFKDGDFIYTEYEDEKCIGILKGDYKGDDQPIELYCALFGITTLVDGFRIGAERKRHDRLATYSEKKEICKMLENRGLFWDSISKIIADINPVFKVGDVVKYETKNGWSNQYLIKDLALAIGGSCSKDELYNPTCGLLSFRSGSLNLKLEDSIGTNSFFKLMEEKGVKFNPESGEVEKIRWDLKNGDHYYYVSSSGEISDTMYTENCEADKIRISIGNFFKRHIQAISASRKFKKLFAEIQAELYK